MRAFSVLRTAFLRGLLRFGFQVEVEWYKLHQLVIVCPHIPSVRQSLVETRQPSGLRLPFLDLLAVPGRAYMKDLLPEIWLFDAESRVLPFIKSEKFMNTTVISHAVDFVS
jgi:hypothetical protein